MTKRIAIIVLAILTMAAPFLNLPLASADTNGITGTYLFNADDGKYLTDSEWCNAQGKHLSWPTSLATCNTGGGTVSNFDKSTSSYAIFRDTQPTGQTITCGGQTRAYSTNRFKIFVASPGKKLTFYKGLDANGAQQYYITTNAPYNIATILAEPNSDPDYKCNWTGSYALNQYETTSGGTVIDPNNISGFRGTPLTGISIAGQVGAVNVNYASSWDVAHLTSHVPYGVDGAANCGTLDIGCWVGKLTSGFTNVIKDLFGLFVDGFKWLFVPDGDNIKASYDSLNAFMNNKLGFLAYPFTFIGNVFSAFTSGSSWCNSSSCTKNFGTLFGQPFVLNLGQVQTTMPTIWTWFTAMIRGITILLLLLAVRNKYRSVTAK